MLQKPKPFLGIQGEDVSEEIAKQYEMPQFGVYIVSIIPNSSAEKAGIQPSDVITSFNGTPIFGMKQLQEEVALCKVGDEVEVKLYRTGKRPMTFKVRLAEYISDNF
jgi:serine protease Do